MTLYHVTFVKEEVSEFTVDADLDSVEEVTDMLNNLPDETQNNILEATAGEDQIGAKAYGPAVVVRKCVKQPLLLLPKGIFRVSIKDGVTSWGDEEDDL